MPQANKTPCRAVPNTTSKAELKEIHQQKMAFKKALHSQLYREVDGKRVYRIKANLSKRHSLSGRHPHEAY